MARWFIDSNGYRRFSDSGKLVHRWVMEKKFGNRLQKSYVVHHKNRNKLDNRPENLWVFRNQQSHFRTHWQDQARMGVW
jgi:arylamine N-acetyltransferase